MKRTLLLAVAALVLLAVAACTPSASAPQPPPVSSSFARCMITVTTPDGKTAYYTAAPGQTLTVPNGTARPFRAACHDGGWMTTLPGSGNLPW